jgi:hypothetical protein
MQSPDQRLRPTIQPLSRGIIHRRQGARSWLTPQSLHLARPETVAQKFAAPRICSWLPFAADICNLAVKERSFRQRDLARVEQLW